MIKTALFPGTFDPFTRGHESIVERTLTFMDKVVIAIMDNSEKRTSSATNKREQEIKALYNGDSRVEVVVFNGLTTDIAREVNASVIVRGVRGIKDFEYEQTIAQVNKKLSGIETMLLYTEPELAYISSTVVREMKKYGKDISHLLPKGAADE